MNRAWMLGCVGAFAAVVGSVGCLGSSNEPPADEGDTKEATTAAPKQSGSAGDVVKVKVDEDNLGTSNGSDCGRRGCGP